MDVGRLIEGALILWIVGAPAWGTPAPWRVGAAVSETDVQYTERTPTGVVMDNEHGWVPGMRIRLGHRLGPLGEHVTLNCRLGPESYIGSDWSGAPLKTVSIDGLCDFTARVVARWRLADGWGFGIGAGAGYRRWERVLLPTARTSAGHLSYRIPYGVLTGSVSRTVGPLVERVRVSAVFPVGETVRANVGWPVDPRLILHPRSAIGWQVGVNWTYAVTPTWGVRAGVSEEVFNAGRSRPVWYSEHGIRAGLAYEPQSVLRSIQITVGVIARF